MFYEEATLSDNFIFDIFFLDIIIALQQLFTKLRATGENWEDTGIF